MFCRFVQPQLTGFDQRGQVAAEGRVQGFLPGCFLVCQGISTSSPLIFLLAFFSSKILLASKDYPAPVGPVRRIGSTECTATFSICSMRRLKEAFFVSMPDLRKEISSRNSWLYFSVLCSSGQEMILLCRKYSSPVLLL
jgi:hypothetical protein